MVLQLVLVQTSWQMLIQQVRQLRASRERDVVLTNATGGATPIVNVRTMVTVAQ